MNTNIKYTLFIAVLFFAFTANAQVYEVNTQKSKLKWLGEKVTGEHYGTIELKSGEFTIKNGKLVAGKFIINMNSIVCEDIESEEYNKKLVNHLKSSDFFNTSEYPEAHFKISEDVAFSGGSGTVNGFLTIKGKSLPISFKATMHPIGNNLNFYANVIVDRSKYDIKYGSGSFFDDLGDKTIYDEFKVKLNIVSSKKSNISK